MKRMLLGSDGVFEFVDSERAGEIVQPFLDLGATEACAKLVGAATAAWQQRAGDYCDDITAVVLYLQPVTQQLAEFAEQEARKLGLGRDHYTENVNTNFTAEQRPHTTILVRGLTLAHDDLIAAALRG